MHARDALAETGYTERIAFVVELAQHLHAYGTTAQRLEGAIESVTRRLSLACEPWANPTGMILAFSDPARPAGESDTTRVIRLGLGDTDLYKLCEADRIAEDVMAGRLDIPAGRAALRALDRPASWRGRAMQVLGFALASAAVAGLLRLPWLDIGTAGAIGLLIGLLDIAAQRRPRLSEAFEAIAGLLAGAVAIAVSALVGPLNLNTVIIASLIVLLPGMALTNAMNELTSRHLVSGTARFAGAITTILKLTIGTAIAGYLISRFGGEWVGAQAGLFLSALITTAAGNVYARWRNRPGALVRLPGLIMLVPGSIALRGVITLVQAQDIGAGQDAAMLALNTLMALLAGLLFGNLLVSARRNL
ncbi:MAG: threonine/serine exporter family protein [Thermomonas sp.]